MGHMNTTDQRARGIVAILAAAFTWGTIPLILRHVDGAPIIKVFYRVFFAAVVLTLWLTLAKRWRKVAELDRRTIIGLTVQGLILTLNWVLFLGAFERTNVAVVELLGYMGPVFVALIAPLFLNEHFDRRILIPLALSVTGMVIILAPQGLHIGSGEFVGAAMAAASAVTYAMLTVQSKRIMKRAPNDVIIWFEYVLASVVLLPFALYQYSVGNGPSSVGAYGGLVVLGVVQTAFAGWIFFAGLKRLRADQAAIFTYGEPVVAVVLAALFMSQRITLSTFLGGALVIAGGTIVAKMDTSAGVDISPIEIAGTSKEDD